MLPAVDNVLKDDKAFTSSLECIEVVEELERRRAMVAEDKSRLLTEDESWASIRAAGFNV